MDVQFRDDLSIPEPGDVLAHPVHGHGRVWEVNALTLEAVVIYDLGAGLPAHERFRAKHHPVAWFMDEGPDLPDSQAFRVVLVEPRS